MKPLKTVLISAVVISLALSGCSTASNQMPDAESCREIAKAINIVNGILNTSSGDPNEATAVFTEVAKSFEAVAEQTSGDKSAWARSLAESSADVSVSILAQDSEKLTSSFEALMAGISSESDFCPNN